MGKVSARKHGRSDGDLVLALVKHIELLREFSRRCFEEGDTDLVGEVAGKLRLLLMETKNNRPLLIGLMDKYKSKTIVQFNKPWRKETKTLREYRDDVFWVQELPSGQRAILTRIDAVRLVAEQHGASHEDWEHDEILAVVRQQGPFFGDQPAFVPMIRSIARTILSVADAFFRELESIGILKRVRHDA